MKERPILFSAPMVRALLEGSKTQTRRVFKAKNGGVWPNERDFPGMRQILRNCPYGQPGDRLWVKETHWRDDEDGSILYAANPSDFENITQNKHETGSPRHNWKPSIFMRREYSRINLEIVSVRVERLQDISEFDASAEGLLYSTEHIGHWSGTGDKWFMTARDAYRNLWESINGPGSWGENPWVWVVEFKKVAP